jgi:hypothetical protein
VRQELLVAQPNINLNAQMRSNGATALHGACYGNKADVVEVLLLAGADPNVLTLVVQSINRSKCAHLGRYYYYNVLTLADITIIMCSPW